ncbi:MAG: hypothetical protein KDB14_11135, partial [Planctomycetales bacterium]|nr:hypothetical protein [Planctomycetales bacterium]
MLTLSLALSLASAVGAVDTNEATAEKLAQWVNSLGSNDFGARERAEESLSRAGLAAEAALKEGLTHQDLEVRIRAARLLSQLKRLAFERLVEKFVNGGKLETPLPGWRAYAKIVGDSRDSKRLFVNMLKQGEGALQLIEDEKDISQELAVQLQTLTPQFNGVFGAAPTVPGGSDSPAASLGLTLMLASKLTASDYARLSSSLYQVFRNDSPELKANQQLNRMFRHYLEHVLSLETDRSLILYVVL